MMAYEIRRADSREYGRWVIHVAGQPSNVKGSAYSKRGAMRRAQRWMRENKRASVSYPV